MQSGFLAKVVGHATNPSVIGVASVTGVAAAAAGAASDGGSMDFKHLSDLGVVVALVWFLYFTVAVRDPKRDEQHRRELDERDANHRREMEERSRRFDEELREQRRDYLGSLDALSARNTAEREAYRATLDRVAASVDGVVQKVQQAMAEVKETEKIHAEALVKFSHSIDRKNRQEGQS